MGKKVGVYVCTGCGIGDCLDTRKLVELAETECRAPVVRSSSAFCLEDARLIRDDVEQQRVDSVVIAGCSSRVNAEVFFFKPAFVERVNIRERVTWGQPANDPETQSLAEDYLRMGIVRAQKAAPPVPYQEATERRVLVVGGGMAGMAAVIAAAKAGFEVVLVERSPRLGGFAARLHRQFPKHPPYRDLEAPAVAATIRELEQLPGVTVFTSSEIEQIEGQPGRFSVLVRREEGSAELRAGAIVLAAGWMPVEADVLAGYGLGRYPNVVTSVALEEMAAQGRIVRPSDGREVQSVGLILCDGPEDAAHLPYGGSVSSLVALKQAMYLREQAPSATVYLLYEDMQAPGLYEYFYRRVQEDPGVLLSRGVVRSMGEDSDGGILLEAEGTPIGGAVRLKVDLLVLSTGMRPATLGPNGPGILNLRYLQGGELPTSAFGYPDSHYICFPYETQRTGIYSAGAVRKPMDLAASAQDGAAAALKAIQCIEKSSAGAAVHPRVGDLSYPTFFLQKCTSCGRCTQECPFGALELDEKKRPVLNTNRCRRCGICMGACPVQIISFNDYSIDMLSGMIKAVGIPDEFEEKPRILALACENDACPALDMAGLRRLQYSAAVRVIPVRCLGSVNSILIADAVSRGFDGVALMGCRPGDDYQCHFIRGSELLRRRMDNVRETLDQLALESERVQVMEVTISEWEQIPQKLAELDEIVARVGPNPMKGF
ncbi:MAG: hydrogenase iron-sulfur subunit [Chloroflexi bacterium]|nr:hydrogenase iron-sulfur subunit [Chloroflexota bacterium]